MPDHINKEKTVKNTMSADGRRVSSCSDNRIPGGNSCRRLLNEQAVRGDQKQRMKGEIKRKKRNVSLKAKLCISVGTIAAVLFMCMLISFFIGVQSINVIGAEMSTREEIIAASGIEEGIGYFSYNTLKAEKRILDSIPCIGEVEIDRSIFGKVSIRVTEKSACWYTELFNEYYVLSDELEVIRRFESKSEIVGKGLVKLDFPKVESAVLGRAIEISDDGRDCSFVTEFLSEIKGSKLYKEGRINYISIETKFEIYVVCDLKYKIFLGKYSGATVKLDTVKLTLEDESFDGEGSWYLDVSSLPKVVTRPCEDLYFFDLIP